MDVTQNKRLQQLDFLRGIAILLVLLRHKKLFSFTVTMGWIGVDLFFVLSGFLVSGLLFKEYQRFGNVKPGLFLMRRGFKIYPLYYLTYLLYIVPFLLYGVLEPDKVIADLLFFQNYYNGWGYTYVASWSLAVEEHFYFGLAFVLWIIFSSRYKKTLMANLDRYLVLTMLIVFGIRLFTVYTNNAESVHNITNTHLRIDTLLIGVLVSYWYHFKLEALRQFFFKYNRFMLFVALALLCFTPFVKIEKSVFVQTFGFVFLYLSFAIILVYFLLKQDITIRLSNIFSRRIVQLVSKIGYCSYAIYLLHLAVNYVFKTITRLYFDFQINPILSFSITSFVSISLGIMMTYTLESYFLKLRDKRFPSRST